MILLSPLPEEGLELWQVVFLMWDLLWHNRQWKTASATIHHSLNLGEQGELGQLRYLRPPHLGNPLQPETVTLKQGELSVHCHQKTASAMLVRSLHFGKERKLG